MCVVTLHVSIYEKNGKIEKKNLKQRKKFINK